MNWVKLLDEAGTMEDLLQLVNEYILEQPDEYISWIPSHARPTLLGNERDLHAWHLRISDELAAARDPNLRLQDLAVFFLRASARAHEIRFEASNPISVDDDPPAYCGRSGSMS